MTDNNKMYTIEDRKRNGSRGGLARAKNAGLNIGAKWSTIGIADWVCKSLDEQRGALSRNEYIKKLLEKFEK